MPTCAAASVCTDARLCSTHVSAGECAALIAITSLPIAIALALPRCQRTMKLGPTPGGDAFCCSAIPRACVASGFLVVNWLLVACVLPVYAMLLVSPYPCATGLGGCGTISCVAGNDMFEGYVFMFVTLTAAAFLLAREVMLLPASRMRSVLLIAALCVCLTGVYPEHFSTASTLDHGSGVLYAGGFSLHVVGLVCAAVAFVQLPYLRLVFYARREHMRTRSVCLEPDWTRALAIRSAHAAAIGVYMTLLLALRTLPDGSDYCSPLKHDAEACGAWPNLTINDCNQLAALRTAPAWRSLPTGHVRARQETHTEHPSYTHTNFASYLYTPTSRHLPLLWTLPSHGPIGACACVRVQVLPTHYACRFVDDGVSVADRVLLPPAAVAERAGQCIKAECTLFANALSIALEFGALVLIASYTALYALADLKYVLERERDEGGADEPRQDLLALVLSGYVQRADGTAAGSLSHVHGDAVSTPPRTSGMN